MENDNKLEDKKRHTKSKLKGIRKDSGDKKVGKRQ